MNSSPEIKQRMKDLLRNNIRTDTSIEETGHMLDRYPRLREDGWPKRGRFGLVHKHMDTVNSQEIAIKVIKLDFKANYEPGSCTSRQSASVRHDSEATYDFLMACQESVLQKSEWFKHPNIVECHNAWIQPPQHDALWNKDLDMDALLEFIDSAELTEKIKSCLATVKGEFEF